MLKVQQKACATCIYRKDCALDIRRLEAQIADPMMDGHFNGHRICHHSDDAVCAGFWARHRNHFQLGQLAQRLDFVEYVTHEKFPTVRTRAASPRRSPARKRTAGRR